MVHRTDSDFAHFFATDLLGELKKLEKVRRSVLGRVKILIGVIGGVMFLCLGLSWALGPNWTFAAVSVTVCAFVGSGVYKYLISGYVGRFKLNVISRIIEFVDPGLTYLAEGHISRVQFHSSRIFERYPDRLRGDDLVRGKIGETSIAFSEVHAEYKTECPGSNGRKRRRYHKIFKGLFFTAGFNKKFYGKVVVLPDTAERILGGAGSFFQSLNKSRGELIKMEDPEFEKYFVVYGDDQVESRYVLSTSLVQRILDFRRKTGRRIYMSFVGSQVFVAIPYRRGLFEPKVFTKITGFKGVREYFDDLNLALGIVDDLNLNTRIWAATPDVPAMPTRPSMPIA
jgi:hypothetical protein